MIGNFFFKSDTPAKQKTTFTMKKKSIYIKSTNQPASVEHNSTPVSIVLLLQNFANYLFFSQTKQKNVFWIMEEGLEKLFFSLNELFFKVSPTKNICHAVISGTIFNSILFFSIYSLTSQIIFRTPCQKKSVNPMLAVFQEV